MTLVGIAAEIGDVVANPAQRRHQVGHADVHRIGISRPADLGQIEESEDIEAVIDRHLDDVMMPRHLRAFVRRQFVGRAEAETAAMKIDHHRTLAGQARRPDVQLEHVFALVAVVPILNERLLDRTPHGVALALLGERGDPSYAGSAGNSARRSARDIRRPTAWAVWPEASGSRRPCSAPYGMPLNVKTPPSTKPRTLPYCVFATAVRGVEQFPGSWCAAVLMLSDARAVPVSAAPMPAVAESSSAWRRLNLLRFSESEFDMMFPFYDWWEFAFCAVDLFDGDQHLGK